MKRERRNRAGQRELERTRKKTKRKEMEHGNKKREMEKGKEREGTGRNGKERKMETQRIEAMWRRDEGGGRG